MYVLSLLNCTQKQKITLFMEKSTSMINILPKTIEYILYSFFILSPIFLEICSYNCIRYLRLSSPITIIPISKASTIKYIRL